MNKQCLKTTVATVSLIVGSLISACANSGGQYGKENPRQGTVPENVKVLELGPAAVEELKFSENELAVVFAVDKNGKVHVFAPKDSGIENNERHKPSHQNPLPANKIVQMNTITTFQTSNPKTCWLMNGALRCITW